MKYELTNETKAVNGKNLFRIRALRDFGTVKAGDLGGWVESESNLAQLETCWVYDEAQVSGRAQVYGEAQVSGEARVFGEAWVSGSAQVSGEAYIKSVADYIVVGPAQSSGRFTTAYIVENSIVVTTGCFTGTLEEFKLAIEKTHGHNPSYLKQYRGFANFIGENFETL